MTSQNTAYHLGLIDLTPDRRQSRTIFYLQVNRSRVLHKACSIAKTTIAVRKLDVFDWTATTSILAIENVVFDNLKRKKNVFMLNAAKHEI